ncbi:MAG: T9SS type A sorting domain-containing protein, partial [Cyclobacteriaceae bacterium]|nr:T9SS type A sorting domain-containing protein [Cyclobacteriaceae bacterium]
PGQVNANFKDNVWSTQKVSNSYAKNEKSALYSACLDLSNIPRPMLSFDAYMDLLSGEGLVVQYSIDNKNILDPDKTWSVLGDFNNGFSSGLDWYTFTGLPSTPGNSKYNASGFGWSGANPIGFKPKHRLENIGTPSRAIIRFALSALGSSDASGKGIAIDNIRVGSRTRTVLFENFTTTDAGTRSSLNADLSLEAAFVTQFNQDNINSTQVVNINYHVDFVGVDPFNLDNPADPSSRALYYNVSKVPYAFLDGIHSNQLGNGSDLFSAWGRTAYNRKTLQLARADFNGSSVINEADGSIKINVKVKPTIDLPATTTLHVAILETRILKSELLAKKPDAKVTTNETQFDYVLKRMLPNAIGTKFPANTFRKDVSADLGTFTWIPDRFYTTTYSVVLFLQDEITKEVYQAELNPIIPPLRIGSNPNYTLPGLVTGLEVISAESVNIYPNPSDQEFTIELPAILQTNASVRLIDQVGRSIDSGNILVGRNTKTVSTTQLAAGIYIVEIHSNDGVLIRKKVMVVH